MATEKDTVAWDDLARFELKNVADEDIMHTHKRWFALSNNLDISLLLLVI